jgi:ubiquitin carboxyl-terminal hydrolase 4/11
MGGAADLPQRASSPLKRRASDLEDSDVASSQKDDVDMVSVTPSDPPEPTKPAEPPAAHRRAQSVDMLRNDTGTKSSNSTVQTNNMEVEQEQSTATPAADPQNGT